MNNEHDEIRMSMFVDGELSSDQANELLLDVLDHPEQRESLKALLRLRQSMSDWRGSRPARPVMILDNRERIRRPRRLSWRMNGLAAACIGGLLVLAGVWAAGWMRESVRPGTPGLIATGPGSHVKVTSRVTPEQQQQVAKVFALHESVAGPLACYASDDRNVKLTPARGTGAGKPIAVLLKLEGNAVTSKRTLVVVCREDSPAVIELPSDAGNQAGLRVYLAPKTANGKVQVQYAIAADGDAQQPVLASLTGQRRLGLAETSLGQLAIGDRVLHIEAAAWPLPLERN